MKLPWLNIRGRRQLSIVRQATATECGLACVAMIAHYYSIGTDITWLRRRYGTSQKGATLASIRKCCQSLGLTTRAVSCEIEELGQLNTPCILHWRFDHYVVLKSVGRKGVVLHDPARGIVRETAATVREAFTGVALEAVFERKFKSAGEPLRLKLSSLISSEPGLRNKFLAGISLAAICEVLLLTTPFYLQLVIDQVLGKSDVALLNVLLIAFVAILVFSAMASVLRQLTFLFLGHVAAFDITSRVLHKLLSLPIRFFRCRELGDIQHRFQSLSRIQSFIVQGVPALVLDTLFLVLITNVLFLYEARLTLLMFAVVLVWCCWRSFMFFPGLRLSNDVAQTESLVQTHFLESLRSMQSIKVANGECRREEEWRNLFADTTNARIRLGRLLILDSVVRQILFQGARIAAVYYLATAGLKNQMSIGAISAYVAYLGMFTTRCTGVVDRVMQYKLLDVPLSRLSDIIFSDAESISVEQTDLEVTDIELRNLSFSYANDESAVLHNCNAYFERRALVVIAGTSGSGKSTLLQIVAGNEAQTGGELLFGGRPARHTDLRALRSQMAGVFQGDNLLKGTVAENIALLDAEIDMICVRDAAAAACIAGDIKMLPMGYETRIGDLGSSLSRGQMQRILLARAYYRRPQLLLLDEATSGLDGDLERRVIASLLKNRATKIVVSHSDLMLQAADKVLWLRDGMLLSSPHG